LLRVPDPRHDARAGEVVGPKPLTRLERLPLHAGAAHAVEAEGARGVRGGGPRVDVPVRKLALDHVRLDEPRRERVLAFLLVLDLDDAVLAGALAERAPQLFT